MHHVLEHVADPVGFLRAVSGMPAPDGIIHIAILNWEYWETRFQGKKL